MGSVTYTSLGHMLSLIQRETERQQERERQRDRTMRETAYGEQLMTPKPTHVRWDVRAVTHKRQRNSGDKKVERPYTSPFSSLLGHSNPSLLWPLQSKASISACLLSSERQPVDLNRTGC